MEPEEMSLREAIASGDRRTALEAIRDNLAWKLDAGMCRHCGGPKGEASGIAALTLRLTKVMEELDAIPVAEEVSKLDELRARRQGRGADTPDTAHLIGSKSAQRRQGSRRTGGGSRSGPGPVAGTSS